MNFLFFLNLSWPLDWEKYIENWKNLRDLGIGNGFYNWIQNQVKKTPGLGWTE
jgi:hypothetical protein